jgi:hypothetical protein
MHRRRVQRLCISESTASERSAEHRVALSVTDGMAQVNTQRSTGAMECCWHQLAARFSGAMRPTRGLAGCCPTQASGAANLEQRAALDCCVHSGGGAALAASSPSQSRRAEAEPSQQSRGQESSHPWTATTPPRAMLTSAGPAHGREGERRHGRGQARWW